MNTQLQSTPAIWHDPIVQELHEIRGKLVEKYQGNLHAYSQAARQNALALGFQFAQATVPAAEHSANKLKNMTSEI